MIKTVKEKKLQPHRDMPLNPAQWTCNPLLVTFYFLSKQKEQENKSPVLFCQLLSGSRS